MSEQREIVAQVLREVADALDKVWVPTGYDSHERPVYPNPESVLDAVAKQLRRRAEEMPEE